MGDLATMIGSHTFQAADSYGFTIHAFTPAGRFTRPVARSPENRGKDIRLSVEHVRIGVATLGNEADVFRNVGMGGACPLTVHNFVEVIRIPNVCSFHGLDLWQSLGHFQKAWSSPAFIVQPQGVGKGHGMPGPAVIESGEGSAGSIESLLSWAGDTVSQLSLPRAEGRGCASGSDGGSGSFRNFSFRSLKRLFMALWCVREQAVS